MEILNPSYTETKYRKNAESPQFPSYMQNKLTITYRPQLETKEEIGKKPTYFHNKFGYSYESPTYFKSTHSIISKDTYQNPFLDTLKNGEQEKLQASSLKNQQTNHNKIKYVLKKQTENSQKDLNIVDFITNQTKKIKAPKPLELAENEYSNIYSHFSEFKIKRNMFLDFIEKNDMQHVFGPLNKPERPIKLHLVKNYKLEPEKQKRIQEAKEKIKLFQSSIRTSRTNTEAKSPNHLSRFSDITLRLTQDFSTPQLPRLTSDTAKEYNLDKFYSREQKYRNEFNNSIIRQNIVSMALKQKSKHKSSPNINNLLSDDRLQLQEIQDFERLRRNQL